MKITPLAQEHYEDWLPLWLDYLQFYKAVLPESTTALTFRRLIDPLETTMGGFFAQNEADQAVGIVHWTAHRSCWTPGDYCYLQDLFVDPQTRGKGVGTALIEATAAVARTRGCSRVYWLTHETNLTAQKLYEQVAERSGFIQFVKKLA